MTSFSTCNDPDTLVKHSAIHQALDSLPIDKSSNLIIYTINPNDCISCLNGFKEYNGQLYQEGNPAVYVVSVARQIEREELKKKISYFPVDGDKNTSVIWSKKVFEAFNSEGGINLPLTCAIIYNFQKDTVLFAKPVREINDVNELTELLKKNPSVLP
ncbi:MAG: hypothetical protein M3R27_03910 [Bacteroidota bacterium]|nr:hypothetical protein [Bacteroidota bacterium]